MIHVCAFSQFNEPWEKDFFTGEYKSKVQFQYELLCEFFKNSEHVKHVTGLDEITDIPFYLLFNKKDVFLEEIRKDDIGCCFSDCPDDLKSDKNEILKSRRALKKQIKQSEIFEKGKKYEENPLIQNLSEDELLSIFSFLNARELCEISNVCSVFYHVSNLKSVWKNLCLSCKPDLKEERVQEYHDSKSIFNTWKHYFLNYERIFAKETENFLIDKFVSVTNKKFRAMHVTSVLDDSFKDLIYSMLDDILSVEESTKK
jgi:hypothetical protein